MGIANLSSFITNSIKKHELSKKLGSFGSGARNLVIEQSAGGHVVAIDRMTHASFCYNGIYYDCADDVPCWRPISGDGNATERATPQRVLDRIPTRFQLLVYLAPVISVVQPVLFTLLLRMFEKRAKVDKCWTKRVLAQHEAMRRKQFTVRMIVTSIRRAAIRFDEEDSQTSRVLDGFMKGISTDQFKMFRIQFPIRR